MKWIKKGYISVIKTPKKIIGLRDNNYSIDFSKDFTCENEIEEGLLKIIISASDSNKVLDAHEFKKYSKKNYKQINDWYLNSVILEQEILKNKGLITKSFKNSSYGYEEMYKVSEILYEDAVKLVGLKKFLEEFSLISKREYYDVHIWDEYLIFAHLLGISDKVYEQFSKLYPAYIDDTILKFDTVVNIIDAFSKQCYEQVNECLERDSRRASSSSERDYSGSDRDSGGGGDSYSSGGDSSDGSSGGGFR